MINKIDKTDLKKKKEVKGKKKKNSLDDYNQQLKRNIANRMVDRKVL